MWAATRTAAKGPSVAEQLGAAVVGTGAGTGVSDPQHETVSSVGGTGAGHLSFEQQQPASPSIPHATTIAPGPSPATRMATTVMRAIRRLTGGSSTAHTTSRGAGGQPRGVRGSERVNAAKGTIEGSVQPHGGNE